MDKINKSNYAEFAVLAVPVSLVALAHTLENQVSETVYNAAAEMIPYSQSRVFSQHAEGGRFFKEYSVGLSPVISVQFEKEAGTVCGDEVKLIDFQQKMVSSYKYPVGDCLKMVKYEEEPFPSEEDGGQLVSLVEEARQQFCTLYRQMGDIAQARIETHGEHYSDISDLYQRYINEYCQGSDEGGYEYTPSS